MPLPNSCGDILQIFENVLFSTAPFLSTSAFEPTLSYKSSIIKCFHTRDEANLTNVHVHKDDAPYCYDSSFRCSITRREKGMYKYQYNLCASTRHFGTTNSLSSWDHLSSCTSGSQFYLQIIIHSNKTNIGHVSTYKTAAHQVTTSP